MTAVPMVTITLSPAEFAIVKEAVEELLNDSDLLYGGADDFDLQYNKVKAVLARLNKVEQTQIHTH